MARYTEGKCRQCRREGKKLFLKGERCYMKCPIDRKGAIIPGQHGQKGQRRQSNYGIQLREKQKAKRTYGILERQFSKYFEKAAKVPKATGEALLQILELRLDNIIYRLGFAPSRAGARQLVNHGLVMVDGKEVNIPSYQLKVDETISLSTKALAMPTTKKILADKDRKIPEWLRKKAAVGQVVRLPERADIDTEINENLIVEYYSR